MNQPNNPPSDGSSPTPRSPATAFGSALGVARLPGLAGPVALHLLRMPGLTGRELWLYALYEEGGAEFDAAARFDPGGGDGGMAELLAGLMASDDCVCAVVEPLAAQVAKRFHR